MKKSKPLVKSVNIYFGPGVPGKITKNEVFTGEPSGHLAKLINEFPYLKELCATTDEYPNKVAELSDRTSALHTVFEKAEREISRR